MDIVCDGRQPYWLTCSCCGTLIRNIPEENVNYHETPDPHDIGFGTCPDCGGDPSASDIKKKMGWAMVMFVEARFGVVRDNINEENREKWDAFSWEKRANMVLRLVEKGAII